MTVGHFVGLAGVSVLLSYFGVWLLRESTLRRRLLDFPNERSSHTRPTPRGGGVVIVLITVTGLICLDSGQGFLILALGALLIALVSWVDDVRSLAPLTRLAVHSAAAALIIGTTGFIDQLAIPMVGQVGLGWLGLPLTFLWIVGLTNAYNFMDGIDGIAGGQAIVAGSTWALLGWLIREPSLVLFGVLLAASCLGFLFHNWSPATIFMGDVGSAFLGFSFAAITVVAGRRHPELVAPGILLVWPFVFDTSFTFLRRAVRGERVMQAHHSHLYQRLVGVGWTHEAVALVYTAMAVLGAVAGLSIERGWTVATLLSLAAIPIFFLALWRGIVLSERQNAHGNRQG